MELIIADIALVLGPDPPPIVTHIFSAVVIVAVFPTLVMPVALRQTIARTGLTLTTSAWSRVLGRPA